MDSAWTEEYLEAWIRSAAVMVLIRAAMIRSAVMVVIAKKHQRGRDRYWGREFIGASQLKGSFVLPKQKKILEKYRLSVKSYI